MTVIDGVFCLEHVCYKRQARYAFQSSRLIGVRLWAVIRLQTLWWETGERSMPRNMSRLDSVNNDKDWMREAESIDLAYTRLFAMTNMCCTCISHFDRIIRNRSLLTMLCSVLNNYSYSLQNTSGVTKNVNWEVYLLFLLSLSFPFFLPFSNLSSLSVPSLLLPLLSFSPHFRSGPLYFS